jgi:regulator of nucleoside diphosphate kinase
MNDSTTISDNAGLPPIRVSLWDFWRLDALLKSRAVAQSWRADEILARELKRSMVVNDAQIPPDVVTMWSRVEFRIAGAALTQVATLVYPGEGHLYEDAISVLTPFGSAVLGLSEGQSISHTGPDGASVELEILRVLQQPEADRRHGMADGGLGTLELEPL